MPDPTPQGGSVNPADESGVTQIPQESVPSIIANAPHPDEAKTFPVVINGRTEQWNLEKLTAEAQTGAAGREAFQEAAQVRKDNAKAIAVQEDVEALFKDQDMDAFRRLGAQYGVQGDEVERIAAGTFAKEEEEDGEVVNSYLNEQAQAAAGARSPNLDETVGYSRLSPDLQRVMRDAETIRIDAIVKNALDKDEDIAYNMGAQTPDGRAAIRTYVDEKIRGRLDLHNGDFGDGSRILAEVLPEIRTHLQALGTPGQRTRTGLGQAPGGGDTEVHPTKKPDYVASTEGDAFEQNILEEMAFNQAQVERGKAQ